MKDKVKDYIVSHKKVLSIAFLCVMVIVVNLIAALALKISIVPVCLLIILEAAMAGCLHHVELWVHGLVVIAQIIAGVLAHQVLLMVLCAVIYIFALVVLQVFCEGDHE